MRHDCGINNYHSLCGSEASMFTIDVAVHDDDDDDFGGEGADIDAC